MGKKAAKTAKEKVISRSGRGWLTSFTKRVNSRNRMPDAYNKFITK
jgi:hypothetical protein